MPIRTHRGRAAVYRRLWGWPLRSPRHLILAIVLCAAVATGIGLVLPNPPPAVRPTPVLPAVASSTPPSAAPTSALAPTISVPVTTPAPAPPDPQGVAVLSDWAQRWVNHPPGTSQQQWLDRLRPLTTDEWITQMQSIDLTTVPTAITGPPQPVSSTASSIQLRLPTNQGDVRVSLVSTPQGWRVAEYD